MKRELTCIVCPMGCQLLVELSEENPKEVLSVSGNTCKRGEVYAKSECTHPVRTLTTTMVCDDGTVLPVKTSAPIPKDLLFVCMEEINQNKITLPIGIGDVIIKNIQQTGADIIATDHRGK